MLSRARILVCMSFLAAVLCSCRQPPSYSLPTGMTLIRERGGGVPSPDLRGIVLVTGRGEFYVQDIPDGKKRSLGIWARMPVKPGPGIIMWSPDSTRVAVSGWSERSKRESARPDMFIFGLAHARPDLAKALCQRH